MITVEGEKALEVINEVVDESESMLTENLSQDELKQLNSLLNKLRT
jgi:DNA-binding MarR family transcriptional regulator